MVGYSTSKQVDFCLVSSSFIKREPALSLWPATSKSVRGEGVGTEHGNDHQSKLGEGCI